MSNNSYACVNHVNKVDAAVQSSSSSSSSSFAPPPTPTNVTLNLLPDDVLLRIISQSGGLSVQIGIAYRLGAVCTRLRRLLTAQFLPSVTQFSFDCLSCLSLSDSLAARTAFASFFSATSSLRQLDLSGCSPTLLTRDVMAVLAVSACHSLTSVNLAHCRVSDDVLRPLVRCRRLRSLLLISCDGPTGCIFDSRTCIAPLETLDLSYVHSLSDEGVTAIFTLRTVSNLVVKGCEAVSTASLLKFSASNIRLSLKSICLSYCSINDRALLHVLANAPNLQTLTLAEQTSNLWGTGEFTHTGVTTLRDTFPHVKILFLA